MRVVHKAKAIRNNMQSQVTRLKPTGWSIMHNLISKQYRTYSDEQNLYYVSQLIEGEDLFDLLSRRQKLSTALVRHFTACAINILEYLHSRRILWREMKLESFVVDKEGYLMLVDLMFLEQLP